MYDRYKDARWSVPDGFIDAAVKFLKLENREDFNWTHAKEYGQYILCKNCDAQMLGIVDFTKTKNPEDIKYVMCLKCYTVCLQESGGWFPI